MLRTFGTFLRGVPPVNNAAAALRRRPRGVCYCNAATDSMTGPKAKVGQPAPQWRGKAVLNDEIKEISLDQFKVRPSLSSPKILTFTVSINSMQVTMQCRSS